MSTWKRHIAIVLTSIGSVTAPADAQQPRESAASSSLMARALNDRQSSAESLATASRGDLAAGYSMLYVAPPGPRNFAKHDLVQIIVRESTTALSEHDLETAKAYGVEGEISDWPHFDLVDMLNLQLSAGTSTDLPKLGLAFGKEFAGEGEYRRRDDLTARLSAEVVEVLPNGNLVLEARTSIKNDEELQVLKMTGICRSQDVSPVNTVLSSQIFDMEFEKTNSGELKKANEKGLITKIFDFFFAF